MEKIAFSLPLRGLVCPSALVTLDQRNLIDDQIYPTGLPEQFYQLTAHSLLCSSLGLLGCGAGGRLQAEELLRLQAEELLWQPPACFQPLSSLWDPRHPQKTLCFFSPPVIHVLMEGCSPRDGELHPLQTGDAGVLSV